MTNLSLRGQRILITQPMIRGLNGSTVVTLELATELIKLGAKVTVYTCDYGSPMKKIFETRKIKVDVSDDNPNYNLEDFDYVWVHSQILPISIIEKLSSKHAAKIPSFIFLHMSGMDWIPDEKPWIFDLENKISSLSLFISEEVKRVNSDLLSPKIKTLFFRNPAPMEFKTRKNVPSPVLKNLLIVSNHPPKELFDAKNILEEKFNINVSILGEGQNTYRLFEPEVLEKYDAVVTIAKTVQYCLVSGTPVYVYDAYGGGPGWLNESNFDLAKERNFSGYQNKLYPSYEGSVFSKKTAKKIAEEIVNGYEDALSFHTERRKSFYDTYLIEPVLEKIFHEVKPRKDILFSQPYASAVIASQIFAAIRFATGGSLYDRDAIIATLNHKVANLEQENVALANYKKDAEKVFTSKSYKLYRKIISPYIKLRRKNG